MSIQYIGANAGTGKTYFLTHDLADKCASGTYNPENFIFTTFTKSATSDFRERARQTLCSMGMIADANNIDMAFMGTIDSLAQSLVTKYWYLLNLSPKLNIMTNDGRENYITKSLENIMNDSEKMDAFERFRTFFSLKPDFWKEHLLRIIEGYSQYQYIKNNGTQYLDNSRDLSKVFLHKLCNGRNFNISTNSIFDVKIKKVALLLGNLLTIDEKASKTTDSVSFIRRSYLINDFIDEVNKNCQVITYAKFLGLMDNLTSLYNKEVVDLPYPKKAYKSLTTEKPDDSVIENLLNDIEEKLGSRLYPSERVFLDTQKEKFAGGSLDWNDIFTHWVKTDTKGNTKIVVKVLAADLVEFYNQVKDSLFKSVEAKSEIDSYIDLIFEIAKTWDGAFKKFKADNHLLEYQDIESYAYQLITTSQVVKDDLNEQYKVIYVDEFQDCSPLQVKFFYELSRVINDSVWVGDGKQSIYGFRGADIALNNRVASYIQTISPNAPSLTTNYRSFPQLVFVADRLFCNKYGKKGVSKPCLDKLVKQTEKLQGNSKFKSVHYLDYNFKSVKAYFGAIAKRIQKLVEEDHYHPKDIAVLCQTGTCCEKMVAALSKIGMKVNRGFEKVNENPTVRLLSALLQLSVDNRDRKALAEIATLTCKNMDAASIITWKLVDNANFLSTIPIIKLFLEKKDTFNFAVKPVSAIVKSLVYELDLNKFVHQWENGDANAMVLDFLIRLSVAYEDHCKELSMPSTIEGFRKYMNDFSSKDNDDRELQAGALADGVVVTTCHKSKGLQWKVVIMPDLTFGANHHPVKKALEEGVEGVHIVEDASLSNDPNEFESCLKDTWLRLVPFHIKYVREEIAQIVMPSGKNLAAELEAASIDEKIRLLYVTVTRPEEMLFIVSNSSNTDDSGEVDDNNKAAISADEKNTLEWLDLLDISVNSNTYKVSNILKGLINPVDKAIVDKQLKKIEIETLDDSFEIKEDRILKMDECVSLEKTCINKKLEKTDKTKLFVSPSGTYGTVVSKVVRTLNPNVVNRFTKGGEQSENGTLIHNIYCSLEKIEVKDRVTTVDAMLQSSGLRANFTDGAATFIVDAWNFLDAQLKNITDCDVSYFHELPFVNLNSNKQIVAGDIDLICRYDDNKVILVDYKTFPGKEQDVLDPNHPHYAGKYAGQFLCYKEALTAKELNVTHSFVFYPETQTLVELDLN